MLFEYLLAVLAQPPLHSLLQEVISSKLTSKTHLDVTTNDLLYLAIAFHVLSIHYIILLSSGKTVLAFDNLLVFIHLKGLSHYGKLVVKLRTVCLGIQKGGSGGVKADTSLKY